MANNSRKITQLLPKIYQTDTLAKFFSATADHLFQPEDSDFINGYIGSTPSYYDPTRDFYVGEPNTTRAKYQLTPAAVSVDPNSGAVTNALFYDDLINQLGFQGANVDNHSRLFQQEYYSWAPAIDLDKFVNYNQYFWLPFGPSTITFLDPTDAVNDIINQTTYTYNGRYRLEYSGEEINGTITLSTGLKIKLTNDVHVSYNNVEYIVENVGRAILFYEPLLAYNPAWDTNGWASAGWGGEDVQLTADYITIQRGSRDQNAWSSNNHWYHQSVVALSGQTQLDASVVRARKPIIEFDRDIELYNHGTYGRGTVSIVLDNMPDIFGTLVGQSAESVKLYFGGIVPYDGMRFLVTGETAPTINNRIFQINLDSLSVITLSLVNNGQNIDGSPAYGDNVYSVFGTQSNVMLWFNGTSWQSSQSHSGIPIFRAFDASGNSLDDPSVYPNSTFIGTTAFQYETDPSAATDPLLGFAPKLDQFGDFVFNNTLEDVVYQYQVLGKIYDIPGYQFVKIAGDYLNGWNRAPNQSRQYLVNEFAVSGSSTEFPLDWQPDIPVSNQLPTSYVTIVRDRVATDLRIGTDYAVKNNIVTLSIPAKDADRVIIRSWSSRPLQQALTGYFELPLNLTANAGNDRVTSVSRSNFLSQFVDIIANQTGLVGTVLGTNNWRDTARNLGLGTKILQHRAPMLKLMLMNSPNLANTATTTSTASTLDPVQAIQFNQREYQRFYNRFVKSLFNLYTNGGYNGNQTPDTWVTTALKQVNLGKTTKSAYANSGYDGVEASYCSLQSTSPTFVPPTPTRLGITLAYQPTVYLDSINYSTSQLVLQTHDGARIVLQDSNGDQLGNIAQGLTSTSDPALLTSPIAAAWLQFELNIFNNLPARYRDADAVLVLPEASIKPGKWRYVGYNRAEYLTIERPNFERWSTFNQVDFRSNTGFDINDEFSFNYRSCQDLDGQAVPGYWRGIYQWFYDTDRPDSAPWEMLGFSQKPSWWDVEYGQAPYTRGNTKLWLDLSQGYIRRGARVGFNTIWARPGLLNCIPVDDQGALLPPNQAGCVKSLPSTVDAASTWTFGDGAPIEQVWRYSQEGQFAKARTMYLTRPAQFIEYTWDIPRTENAFADSAYSQWIYQDTNRRRLSSEYYVHEENPQNVPIVLSIPNESAASYFGSCGFQHWVSEFLVSQSLSVTVYFGNIMRGAQVKLGHKCAGYIATDSLRVLVDSFGQLGYQSQIVPSENVNTYLYRSTSIGEFFYSGIIVKQEVNGWSVIGYDGITPTFTIIPSETSGPKSSVVIGNQSVTEYAQGNGTTAYVPYGTIFKTRQSVYDFIISYGRWLESQGWKFDDTTNDSKVISWSQTAKEFLFWSQGAWANQTIIALSPLSNRVKFSLDFGTIQLVPGLVSGTYPVLDKIGIPIEYQNLEILRDQNEITIRTTNSQTLYGVRLFSTTLEHAILFDNVTVFNDIIYQPLYNLAQPRLKLLTYRTNNWTGRVDAPGYFLSQSLTDNTWNMVSNFEKTADDIRKYFNVDQPVSTLAVDGSAINTVSGTLTSQNTELAAVNNQTISALSKHLVGYQKRDYLQNLLLEDSVEFEFYQGFIRQKGTKSAIDALLRNSYVIPSTENFEYYEEFALRVGNYGATRLNNQFAFNLSPSDITNNPQRIEMFYLGDNNATTSDSINLTVNDPRIITQPLHDNLQHFNLLPINAPTAVPTAGYPAIGETDWIVFDNTELVDLYASQKTTLKFSDTVWQITDDIGNWTVWQLASAGASVINTEVTNTLSGTGALTTINFDGNHLIDENDLVIITGVANVTVLDGTFNAINVTATSIDLNLATSTMGFGGQVYIYKKARFATVQERDANPPPNGWQSGNHAWVDSSDQSPSGWGVYVFTDQGWAIQRVPTQAVDAEQFQKAIIYRSDTLEQLSSLSYFNPLRGYIPGAAEVEIDYKSAYDPAGYNQGDATIYNITPNTAWGRERMGTVWWNLGTTRYINYETGENSYRTKYWGKLVPGSTIDIYEWVRSPIPPSEWNNYVTNKTTINQLGTSYIPSGSVIDPGAAYTETLEYDATGTASTWYYFWVANSTMSPQIPSRNLTTKEISSIIADPTAAGIAWYAAINDRSIVVANIKPVMYSNLSIFQLTWGQPADAQIEFNQWKLSREGDPSDTIDSRFWSKMKDSLVGYDALGNSVPDIGLHPAMRYGTMFRPRQSWFKDRVAAIDVWVSAVNTLIAAQTAPLVTNPDITGWLPYFTAQEPFPDPSEWTQHVPDVATRNAMLSTGRISAGQIILLDAVPDYNNLWTLQYWDGSSWIVTRTQGYSVDRYWSYVDWYATGYSATTSINFIVNTEADLAGIAALSGQVAKVINGNDNLWQWFVFNGTSWTIVAQQNGSIAIDISYQGWDTLGWDNQAFDVTPDIELGYMFDGAYNSILATPGTGELNSLFYSMLNYVFVEQGFVDWALKTSYIVLRGFNQPLDTVQLYVVDLVESILGFINEVKPYHTKIRQFISGRTATDIASTHATDFDNPVYNDQSLLPPTDDNILGTDPRYVDWYNNYLTNPQLIRTLKTKLVYDRISNLGSADGAAGRIATFYEPTQYQPPKTDAGLIDADFKGTYVDTLPLAKPGWDNRSVVAEEDFIGDGSTRAFTVVTPIRDYSLMVTGNGVVQTANVDYTLLNQQVTMSSPPVAGEMIQITIYRDSYGWGDLGWDPSNQSIDDWIDYKIQAGQPPIYNAFYGDGTTTTFTLNYVPQELNKVVVWADNQLQQYGTDWTIPNWIGNARVQDSGTGYSIGDHLQLDGGTYLAAAEVIVSNVGISGEIISVDIANTGDYSIVPQSPISSHPIDFTTGTGATFDVVWRGRELQFAVAPAAPIDGPTVFVLFGGTTFEAAPKGDGDTMLTGNEFIEPDVAANHPPELYNARIRNSTRIDVKSLAVGGSPQLTSRHFLLDGATDQVKLPLIPQSQQAVLAHFNGALLQYGPTHDYVVDFATGILTFVTMPAAGALVVNVYGLGGSGNNVDNVFIVNPGSGYLPGDTITLSGLQQVGNAAVITVDNVVVSTGAISNVSISNAGNYQSLPVQPLVQSGNVTSGGTGASFAALFNSIVSQETFIGDNSTVDFTLQTADAENLIAFVTIDGTITNNYVILGQSLHCTFVPGTNSLLKVTFYQSNSFSIVQESDFTIQAAQYIYNLSIPASSTPMYSSALVYKNGLRMTPPPMANYLGNAATTIFAIPLDMNLMTDTLFVYVNGVLKTNTVDYNIAGSSVTFTTAPSMNSVILFVGITVNYDYQFVSNNQQIQFRTINPGDEITVRTFSNDFEYGFITDTFTSNDFPTNYVLSRTPWDSNNVVISVAGSTLSPTVDFNATGNLVTFTSTLPPTGLPVAITYSTKPQQEPELDFRLLIGHDGTSHDQSLQGNITTRTLSQVLPGSLEIEIEDYRVLTAPTRDVPGYVTIDDELIAFWGIRLAPTGPHPYRAFLMNTQHDRLATSGSPKWGNNYSHANGATVTDSGSNVEIPGGYNWESTPWGLQRSRSPQAEFLLNRATLWQ